MHPVICMVFVNTFAPGASASKRHQSSINLRTPCMETQVCSKRSHMSV